MICATCGAENREGARFCDSCGAALAAEPEPRREERKVVSVLFCDLVGFTARADRMDPEEVRRLLQPYHARLRGELERHGGTVEKFIGDAVMAVFGAPVAHEDDPERAVRAGLAVRDAIAEEGEHEVRIGVTTGEALIALGARAAEGEGIASGDVVNTASRLQAAAPINAVLVDETTFRATERVIDYRAREAVAAKGKPEPIPVWEAARARARVGVERLHGAPLVGREQELAILQDTLARAEREREPQLITLVGVPGIGKSRLVFELFQTLEQDPELRYWRHGRSLPYGEGVTFWALSEIVKAQAGILESDDADQVERKLRQALDSVFAEPEEREWVERHLRPLAGLETGHAQDDQRSEAFVAWRRFLETLAEHRPLVLLFEDLHWADEALLDFVDELVDRARGVPMLVLATARPELLDRRPGWGGGKLNASTILVSALSHEETARLVHALLGRTVLDASVQSELLERAGGNPLYAEEFARMKQERPAEHTLPESVQGLIAARLDALPRPEKELVQSAAVMGRSFWLGWLGQERWASEELLRALERKEFVRRERRSTVAGEVEYAFRHALVRDVAYDQIPRAERGAKHLAAAAWIELLGRPEDHAELLAHHYAAALDYSAATEDIARRARAALVQAGDRAFSLNAFVQASSFYERALELNPGDDAEIVHGWAEALYLSGDERRFEAMEDARRRLVAEGRPELAAEIVALLARGWWHRGIRDNAFEKIADAQALVRDQPPSPSKVRVLSIAARFRVLAAENREGLELAREALGMLDHVPAEQLRPGLLGTIGIARVYLGDAGGREDMLQSLELARRADLREATRSAQNANVYFYGEGDLQQSASLAAEALALAEQSGDADALRFQQHVSIWFDLDEGRWDEALAKADEFLAARDQGSPDYAAGEVAWQRATIALARGDDDGALADVARSLSVSESVKDPQMVLPALSYVVRAYVELGRLEDARRIADEYLLLARDYQGPTYGYIHFAWVAKEVDRAQELAEVVAAHARQGAGWIVATRAVLEGDYARAADVFVEMGSQQHEAYARLKVAEKLNGEGRRTEADEQLRQAVDFFRSVGATRYIRLAQSELGAAAEAQ